MVPILMMQPHEERPRQQFGAEDWAKFRKLLLKISVVTSNKNSISMGKFDGKKNMIIIDV